MFRFHLFFSSPSDEQLRVLQVSTKTQAVSGLASSSGMCSGVSPRTKQGSSAAENQKKDLLEDPSVIYFEKNCRPTGLTC